MLPKESDSFGEADDIILQDSPTLEQYWLVLGCWVGDTSFYPHCNPRGSPGEQTEARPLCKVPRLGQSQACLNPPQATLSMVR